MHKYDVVDHKTIGEGGFGKAKLVRTKTENSDLYIMKIMDYNKWAYDEAKILQSLNHKNIIKYVDSFREGNKFHLIMEYAKDGDLENKLKPFSGTKNYFLESRVKDWFLQICSAIKYIHSKNILHRDLKPSNIFIDYFNCLKVGDFGLSKQLNNSNDYTKSFCGTPIYMAHEVLTGKPYGKKADIYSLGCILFQLLTLELYIPNYVNLDTVYLPHYGVHHPKLYKLIPLPIDSDIVPYVDTDKWRYLLKLMLSPNPNARPSIERVIDIVNEIKPKFSLVDDDECNIC